MRRLHTNQVFFYRRRVAFECWSPLCATTDTHEHTQFASQLELEYMCDPPDRIYCALGHSGGRLRGQSLDWQTKQYRKIHKPHLKESRQRKTHLNKTTLVQSPLTTLGQETRCVILQRSRAHTGLYTSHGQRQAVSL